MGVSEFMDSTSLGVTRRVESVRKVDFDQDFDFDKSGLSWLLEFCLDLSVMYIDIGSSGS